MYRRDVTNYLFICLSTCLPIYLFVLQTVKSNSFFFVFRFFPLNKGSELVLENRQTSKAMKTRIVYGNSHMASE